MNTDKRLTAAQDDMKWSRDRKLRLIAPGLYHDDVGGKFFYLTRIYPWIEKRLLESPNLQGVDFIEAVFARVRSDFEEISFIELMD